VDRQIKGHDYGIEPVTNNSRSLNINMYKITFRKFVVIRDMDIKLTFLCRKKYKDKR